MQILTLDFETYYDKEYSLSKMSTEAYIRDPRFEVIGVSVKAGDVVTWFTGTRRQTRDFLIAQGVPDALVCAHNAHFDGAILHWHLGIKPKGYLDTLSMANAMHGINESVSLKALAERYALPAKGTAVHDAIGKHRSDFTPTEMETYGEYCRHDTELCAMLFDIMVPRFSKQELKLISMTVRMFVEPVLHLDIPVLEAHLAKVRATHEESMAALSPMLGIWDQSLLKSQLLSNQKFALLLQQLGVEPPTKISTATGKTTWAFAKTDEEFTDLCDHEDPIVRAAVSARLGNKSSLEETRSVAFIGIAERGLMPFPLKYSGAHITNRWSAFDSINAQNMPRGGELRRSIRAPAGFKLVGADLSNIELRLGLWLVGQEDKLDLIRQGRDLYMDVAAAVYHKSYDEIEALGKKSAERTCAKIVSLSSIFGTGAAKLRDTLRRVGKTIVTQEEAQRMTDLYREDYTRVVASWREGTRVLDAIYAKTNYGTYLKVLDVSAEGMMKPSGLLLPYPDLAWTRGDDGKDGYTYAKQRGARDRVYGSKCMQRAVQSLARDIIAEHMAKIDKRFWVAGTVHDEIICVVADEEVEDAKQFMLEVMRTPPAWCKDLPLDAEVSVGDNYGDAH